MLHILRGILPRLDGRPISPESLIRLLRRWNHTGALFGTWTRRKPGRTAELEGGSVYFVARGWTLFLGTAGADRAGTRLHRTPAGGPTLR